VPRPSRCPSSTRAGSCRSARATRSPA
jgi:hypothetical protein